MHAIRQYKPGKLVYERVPEPSPGRGQVRIAVKACVVDRGDAAIPGQAVAGVVDKLGEGVPHRWRDKRVAVHLGPDGGGYADHAVASVESLHALPSSLDDAAAAAMVGIGRRAMGIVEVAGLVPGDVVLVLVSRDGLGPLLAQSAHNVRATVALTDGATIVGGPVTAVLDGVGGKAGRAAFDLLAPGGRMVHQQGKGWAGGDGYSEGAGHGCRGDVRAEGQRDAEDERCPGRASVGAVATGLPEFDGHGGEKAIDDKRPDRGGHRVGAEAKGELASVDGGGVGRTEGDQAGAAALNPEGEVAADAGHDPAPRRRRLILSVAESRSSEG